MNSIDIFNGYMNNHETYAKKQAKIDSIYKSERKKYDRQFNNNSNNDYYQNHNNTYNQDIILKKLNRIESRIDKLYEIIGNNNGFGNNKLFVCLDGEVNCRTSVALTDQQFDILINKLMKD